MFTINDVLHAGLLVENTARSLEFYQGVLGLERDARRPDLGYPGAWLRMGRQQIHLMELPNPDPVTGRPAHGGRDRHVALGVSDVEELRMALDAAGIAYTRSRSGRKALFCRDPDGNALEFVEQA
ncbi:MAG: VOC family protein [Gammaproteobacteria bacterium]|jgi:glyoxylase I family protein